MSKDYRSYASKEITPTMDAFADWILAEVYGGELPEGVDDAVFRKSVALGGSLRMEFQRSEFWKSDARNYLNNVEANREAKALAAAESARVRLEKAQKAVKAAEDKAKLAVAAAKAKAEALAA